MFVLFLIITYFHITSFEIEIPPEGSQAGNISETCSLLQGIPGTLVLRCSSRPPPTPLCHMHEPQRRVRVGVGVSVGVGVGVGAGAGAGVGVGVSV